MSDTPRTDAISGWGVTYRGKSSSEELYIDPKGPFVHSTFARQLERELNEATTENTRLRAALATSKDPCTYCQLPKEEMAKCRSGFPGCARADDLMGCPELGAALEVDRIERELDEARTRIKELADIGGALAAQIEVEAIDAPGSVRRVREWQETVKRCLDGVE